MKLKNKIITVLTVRLLRTCTAVIFFSCLSFSSFGQLNRVPINLPKYDKQKIHFGFTLGINSSTFRILKTANFRNLDSIYTVEPKPTTGLNLGIVSNLRLGEHWDLRFIPALSFSQRKIDYTFQYPGGSGDFIQKSIESTYLEFPLDLKFKSTRINNYRVYVLAGGKYAIDMISQAKVKNKDKDIIKLDKYDYGYEVGIGFDFYMTYFKFSPELKMFNGLNNLLIPENTVFASPLSGLKAKVFLISFTFE